MSDRSLIIGDVHLAKSIATLGKPGIGTALNSRLVDQIKLLDWIFDKAQELHVSCLFFTGDIFEDGRPDYIVVKIFLNFLKRCADARFEVHIIRGNHDLKRSGNHYTSVLDIIDVQDSEYIFIHKDQTTVYREGVGFTLLPFQDRKSLNAATHDLAIDQIKESLLYELNEIPLDYDKVLIGHLALHGSIFVGDEIDDTNNELMCPLSMFKGYDYVWMGHVHKPQVRSKNPYIAHIGSLDISDFGEVDHTKILILYDPDLPHKFEEIPVPSRPLRKLSLEVPATEDTTSYLINQITSSHQTNSLKDAIIKLEVKLEGLESKNADRKQITKLISDLGGFYLCSFSESRNVSVVALDKTNTISDNTIRPKAAIKLWAKKTKFSSDQDKKDYLSYALATVEKLK